MNPAHFHWQERDEIIAWAKRVFGDEIFALEDADATVMARNLGLVDKNAQKGAKELILSQPNGRALVRSQHFMPYAEIQIVPFEERINKDKK